MIVEPGATLAAAALTDVEIAYGLPIGVEPGSSPLAVAPASLSDPATHSAASSIAGPAGLPMTLRTYSMGGDFHGRGCAPQAGFEQMASF